MPAGLRNATRRPGRVRISEWLRWLAPLFFALSCRKPSTTCTTSLETLPSPVGSAELEALPEEARLVDEGLVSDNRDQGCARAFPGSEYGNQIRRGRLGPFAVEYGVFDYKGLPVTTGATATIADPPCPRGGLAFTMLTQDAVRLRHDSKRDVYFVSNLNRAEGAIAFRRVATGR